MVSHEVFFKKAREIGPAIWLLIAYWAVSALDRQPWFVVAEGAPITDEETADFIRVSTATVTRRRKRLMRVGLVQADKCRGGGFHIRVQRTNRDMEVVRTLQAHSEVRDPWAHLATEVVQ